MTALASLFDAAPSPERIGLYLTEIRRYSAEQGDAALVVLFRGAKRFPSLAEAIEALEGGTADERRQAAERARHAAERARHAEYASLVPELGISEDQRLANVERGMALVRRVLREMGVPMPIDTEHATDYDPPLNVAETRHQVHVTHRSPQPAHCRFCAAMAGVSA